MCDKVCGLLAGDTACAITWKVGEKLKEASIQSIYLETFFEFKGGCFLFVFLLSVVVISVDVM